MGWEELVAKKRKALAELIPEKWRIPADKLPVDSQHSVISYPETSGKESCFLPIGAVLYVKTNVPQSVMVCETINNIVGRTLNPYNRLLSCGGSSGGETALIALHGSPIGVGTDIGGSIRTPAAFNGLWGIRPSHGRMPFAGVRSSMDGQETVHSVCGPIAHRAEDLAYFMKAILEQEPWDYDPKVIEIPWREEKYNEGKTGKKIFGVTTVNGVLGFDGVVMPHPPILRGIQMVVNALQRAGHTVVEWRPYKHKYAVDLVRSIYRADGGEDIRNALTLSGEPVISEVANDYGPGVKEKIDLNAMWNIQIKKYKYQQEYLAIWMERNEINAWIQPEAPHAAIRHDQYKYNGYASVINLLDYPAVVVPVTFAQKQIDIKDLNYKAISDLDMQVHDEYQADVYHGAPVAVQIIGRRLQEEYVIGLAEQVGRALASS
ncbi:unnamed protein product [Rotaria sp. Silwood1]|nr:unnamed protein product [Rotaria sp. Silwood1]